MTIIACDITDQPIDTAEITRRAHHASSGAVVTFEGVVRNHDQDRPVDAIEYSAHPDTQRFLAEIAADFTDVDGIENIGIVHRIGLLPIGDVALLVVVSGHHRQEAFGTAQQIINEIKARLPIWKKQIFADGPAEWSGLP